MGPLLEAAPPHGAQTPLQDALGRAPDVRGASLQVVDHLAAQGLMPSVYLEQGGRLRCQAVRGYWQIFDGMGAETGVIGRTFQSGEPTVELDVSGHPDYLAAVEEVVAEICVPVRVLGKIVGVLNVESTEPLAPEIEIEVSRCATLLGGRLTELAPLDVPSPAQALARVGARLATLTEPEAILEATAQAACELSGFSSALLALAGPEDRRFGVGPLKQVLSGLEPTQVAGMAGWVDGGTSSYTMGESGGRGFAGHEALRRAGTAALAVLPLAAAGDRLGILVLADPLEITLTPDVVELLELLAMQAASVLGTAFALRELRRRAECDALTGLGHHATFNAELAVRRREATGPVVVILVDVDNFKSINDELGHASGDAVLRATAATLRGVAGGSAYRIGGDEFAVVLEVDAECPALPVGQWLCDTARDRIEDATISAGVAVGDLDETDSELIARADAALYAAKAAGRDRAVLSPPPG